MTTQSFVRCLAPRILISGFLLAGAAHGKNIGADPAPCPTCGGSGSNRQPNAQRFNGSSWISLTEGNLLEPVVGPDIRSSAGATARFTATYNSYNADGSRATIDTVMGYGWTHSWNTFLFTQFGAIFRYDGAGRVTKYGLGPGGTFVTAAGYFETLVKNLSGTYTLTQKDKTAYTFASVPGTPFLVGGPVWRLVSVTDRNGNTTTLTYTAGNLTSVTDTYGRALTFAYNGQNKVTSVSDPAGRTMKFQYDPTGHKITQVTDPNGKTIQYSYNTLYQLTSKTDRDGRTFSYIYTNSEPIAVNDSAGASPATLSSPGNWATNATALAAGVTRTYVPATTTLTDSRGSLWKYQYDSNGYVTQLTAPDGSITSYTYDPVTLMTASMTDANGHTTGYTYNSQGDLLTVTDALGHVTTYTYEPVFNMVTSMTDPRGRVTTYTIDPTNGNRTQETDPLGQTRKWTYDLHGNITRYTDKNGIVVLYSYDASGNLTQETDAAGTGIQSTTQYSNDGVGNRISTTDALARVTQYQYDGLNRVIQETDAVGTPQQRTIKTTYDGEGGRIQVTDGRGIVTQYQYDLRQRPVTEIDAFGTAQQRTTSTTYDANNNRLTVTDPLGRINQYQYDTRNRTIQETDALGTPVQAITRTAYDAVSNIISITDADGHTTSYGYDPLNRRSSMTDALGEQTLYFYDGGAFPGAVTSGGVTVTCNQCGVTPGSSLITRQVDPDGTGSIHAGTTWLFYDALDRLLITDQKTGCIGGPAGTGCPSTINTASDAVTLSSYDPTGNRVTMTEADGNTARYQYDAKNRLVQITDAAGDVTSTTYDLVNNVATVIAPNLNVTTNTYDALNRVIQVSDSVGLVGTGTYDADNNRISGGDGNGNITAYSYDALNRASTSVDPLGKTTINQYDLVNNQLSVTDRNGNKTTYTYDALNRRSTMTDALGNTTTWQYDFAGNLTVLTDARTHSTLFSYDPVNRPHCETYADGTMRCYTWDPAGNLIQRQDAVAGQTVTYSYNDLYFLSKRQYAPSGASDSFTYDLSGRMLTNQRQNGPFNWAENFTYDGANRLTQTVQNTGMVRYTYNIPGRTRTVTYPGGRIITESADARARLDHINNLPSLVQYTYDLANNMLGRNYNNGTTSSYTYNANNWTTAITHRNASPFAAFAYTYDNEGNRLNEQKTPNALQSECYGYDTTYRLISYQSGTPGVPNACPVAPPAPTQTSYSLDPVGNWNSKTTNAVTQTRTHNTVNEITAINSTALTYDSDGDLTNDGTYAYQYDEEHRLTGVTAIAGSVASGQYQYDALSRRVQKIANPAASSPVTTLFFYDDSRVIEEQNPAKATLATYVYGNYIDEILTMDRGGATFYYHQNGQWSIEAVTDTSGNPVERYSYDAYGAVTVADGLFNPIAPNSFGTAHSAIGNPWTFTGRQFDEEAGLYLYRARYYDPAKGRFLQRDTLEYRDSMNLYAYTGDNPVNRLDPSGHGWSWIGAVAGAVAGAIVATAIVVAVAATAPISVPVLIGAAVIGTVAAAAVGGVAAGSLPPNATVTDRILVGALAGGVTSLVVTPAFIFVPGLAAVSARIGAPIAARFPIIGRLLPRVPIEGIPPVRPPLNPTVRGMSEEALRQLLRRLGQSEAQIEEMIRLLASRRPPILPPGPPGPPPPPPLPPPGGPPLSGPPLPPTVQMGIIPFLSLFSQPGGPDSSTCPLNSSSGGSFDSVGSSYPDVMSSSYSSSYSMGANSAP